MSQHDARQSPDLIPLNYADPRIGRGKVIARFPSEVSVHLAAARLCAEDIDAVVCDMIPSRALGARSAVLVVPADDESRAVEILKMTPAKPFLLEADAD